MLLVASVLLVAVAFVTLVFGVFSDTLAWVFVSLGCTLAAGIALYLLARVERRVTEDVSTGGLRSG